MKKYGMLALATIFMFCAAAMAQNPTPPQNQDHHGEKKELKHAERPMLSPEKRAEKLAKELELSEAQKADVQALFVKQEAKRHEEVAKIEKLRAEMRTKFEAQRKSNDEALAKIIGKEKFEKLQSLRSERLEKMNNKREKFKGTRENAPKNEPAEVK
jgi:Spy/CpxP family protein refolding chaperone